MGLAETSWKCRPCFLPPCCLAGALDGLKVSRFSNATGGSRWGLRAPAGIPIGWTRLDLKDVPWHGAGDLCGVALQACAAGENEVQIEEPPCEPVTLVIWRLRGRRPRVYGDGFRPLVLGCSGTHSHVCGESARPFC